MSGQSFALRPQRQRLREEPEVIERVEWRTLRTAEIDSAPPRADESSANGVQDDPEDIWADF